MKKLHHIVLVLALAATLFTGCNKDEGVTPRPPVPETADQTIMFYLTGTNLGSYFRKNVDDAMNAIDRNILHNSRVLVFIQPQRGLSMVLELYYTPRNDDYVPGAQFSYEHCKVDTLRRWADADFNSMDRGTITEVISYMAEQAPARRYGLILGGHGLGWVPDGTSVNAIRFSAFQDFWSPMPNALPTRWMGDSGKRAEIPQLAAAFGNTGLHFDYLLFDACFMSSIEALYDLRGCADRIIASPCEVMAAGFNYTDILPHLLADAGTSYDLPGVCSEYYDYYMNRATTKSGCIALTVTGELEPLAAIVKEIETKYPGKRTTGHRCKPTKGSTSMYSTTCRDTSRRSATKRIRCSISSEHKWERPSRRKAGCIRLRSTRYMDWATLRTGCIRSKTENIPA